MMNKRCGLIVWVHDVKAAKNLERYGTLHYISKKMNYSVLYVDSTQLDEVTNQLSKLSWVRKVEQSYRNEIKTEYTSNVPDKTRFYSL